MSKIKHFVGLLALIAVSIGLFSFFKVEGEDTDAQMSSDLSPSLQQHQLERAAEVQPAAANQDPFKKFLDDKSSNPNSSSKFDSSKAIPAQAGQDPFKAFLEKQQQNSKEQVVSPFGQN